MNGWVRIADVHRAGLPAEQIIELLATALTELGIAQALVMIHGVDPGFERYTAMGGRICFDHQGEPMIRLPESSAA